MSCEDFFQGNNTDVISPGKEEHKEESKDSYLRYGYDVINSKYINGGDIIRTKPILSLEKMNDAKMIVTRNTTKSEYNSWSGKSISELYNNMSNSFNAGLDLGIDIQIFSGKASEEFQASNFEHTQFFYAKGIAMHVSKEEYLSDASPDILKSFLSDGFITAVAKNDPKYILDNYGSHLVVRCYWGGATEFNYSYYGEMLKTSNNMQSAMNASLKYLKSGTNIGLSSQEAELKEELEQNSSFNYHSIGGNITTFSDLNSLMNGYEDWVLSTVDKPDLCGIQNFQQDLLPIWELINDDNLAAAVKKEFEDRAVKQGILLGQWKNLIEKTATYNIPGNYSFSFSEKFPVKIEVFLTGGGGGGQGENRRKHTWPNKDNEGTGGAGGGAASAYLSFISEENVNMSIIIGKGGKGGAGRGDSYEGYPGLDGEATSINWKGIIVNANGGQGGGAIYNNGGIGGIASINIPDSNLYTEYKFDNGTTGDTGDSKWGSKHSRGGNSGKIDDFGGTGGGDNAGEINATETGGGGAGAARNRPDSIGGKGGDGLVLVKYTYFADE